MARRRSGKGGKTYVELEGIDELRKALVQLNRDAIANSIEVIRESAETILADTKAHIPDRKEQLEREPPPGETRESYSVRYRDGGLSATIGSSWYIARFRELGTSKMPAQPALFPSWEAERPNYLQNLAEGLNQAGRDAEAA